MDFQDYRRRFGGAGNAMADLPGSGPEVDSQDVNAFQAALSRPSGATQATEGGGGSMLSMLSNYGASHDQSVRGVERNLMRAAETGEPVKMLRLQKEYSQLMLQHAMATKVVGKTVQAVDSLTKLQ